MAYPPAHDDDPGGFRPVGWGAPFEPYPVFPSPPPRVSCPEARGLRHLAFRVDDLDAAIAHLSGHGVATEPVRVDEYTGRRFTFFADPDDLPLELYEEPGSGLTPACDGRNTTK